MPIPMAQVLRLYIQMFLSYWLYVCIILETAIHRTTLEYFKTLLKRLHQLYFFVWEGEGYFGRDKDKISSGEGKRKG